MVTTYNFLKTAYQDIKNNTKENSSFLLVLLLLISIPLPYFVNNIVLAVFLIVSILQYKKTNVQFSIPLILPVVLYALMCISFFWSLDSKETFGALSKEITLFLLPLAFMVNKKFTENQLENSKKYYSYSMLLVALVFLIRAAIRYVIHHDSRAFFYHGEDDLDYGLVPKLLNAIHVSVFAAVALFYFISKAVKSKLDHVAALILLGFILLLSSKNIILIVIVLLFAYFLYFSKVSNKLRLRNLIVFGLMIAVVFSFGKIKERFLSEFQANTKKSISTNVIEGIPEGVHYVSLYEAWTNDTFTANDYFPGTAFRVYQFRIFLELLDENPIFFSGFGLNASKGKLIEKEHQYNLYGGYGYFNFHNQYVQNFADLGIFGFLLLVAMLFINLKKAVKSKDFVHFTFAILMISLFLTESFLWRQRGVVFFTLFYCLFNATNFQQKLKT